MLEMNKASATRMIVFVALLGLTTSVAALLLVGSQAALSVGVGATLALANFVLLRTIVAKVVDGALHRKGPVIGLLFLKMGGLMGLVYLVIARHWVEPIAFTVGLSSLVVGLIASSFVGMRDGRDSRENET
jgi:ATP synthase I chain